MADDDVVVVSGIVSSVLTTSVVTYTVKDSGEYSYETAYFVPTTILGTTGFDTLTLTVSEKRSTSDLPSTVLVGDPVAATRPSSVLSVSNIISLSSESSSLTSTLATIPSSVTSSHTFSIPPAPTLSPTSTPHVEPSPAPKSSHAVPIGLGTTAGVLAIGLLVALIYRRHRQKRLRSLLPPPWNPSAGELDEKAEHGDAEIQENIATLSATHSFRDARPDESTRMETESTYPTQQAVGDTSPQKQGVSSYTAAAIDLPEPEMPSSPGPEVKSFTAWSPSQIQNHPESLMPGRLSSASPVSDATGLEDGAGGGRRSFT